MKALILGISGQDGSYMAELLLEKGYEVYGLVRRVSSDNLGRLSHISDSIELVTGDITDSVRLQSILRLIKPDEIYNFAAQSHVGKSFENPEFTCQVTGVGAVKLFESVRQECPNAKIYQASSSEMFGNFQGVIDEETPFAPVSPYGVAKVMAHEMAVAYRNSYKMFIACGIAFNHESERRSAEFVTRKITQAAARIKCGCLGMLWLGNITAERDWSHAKDIVRGAWLILQQDSPSDYILCSGESHSVKRFLDLAFENLGLKASDYLQCDERLMRPTDIHVLRGCPNKAKQDLKWTPEITFEGLVSEMVSHDALIHNHTGRTV